MKMPWRIARKEQSSSSSSNSSGGDDSHGSIKQNGNSKSKCAAMERPKSPQATSARERPDRRRQRFAGSRAALYKAWWHARSCRARPAMYSRPCSRCAVCGTCLLRRSLPTAAGRAGKCRWRTLGEGGRRYSSWWYRKCTVSFAGAAISLVLFKFYMISHRRVIILLTSSNY